MLSTVGMSVSLKGQFKKKKKNQIWSSWCCTPLIAKIINYFVRWWFISYLSYILEEQSQYIYMYYEVCSTSQVHTLYI